MWTHVHASCTNVWNLITRPLTPLCWCRCHCAKCTWSLFELWHLNPSTICHIIENYVMVDCKELSRVVKKCNVFLCLKKVVPFVRQHKQKHMKHPLLKAQLRPKTLPNTHIISLSAAIKCLLVTSQSNIDIAFKLENKCFYALLRWRWLPLLVKTVLWHWIFAFLLVCYNSKNISIIQFWFSFIFCKSRSIAMVISD